VLLATFDLELLAVLGMVHPITRQPQRFARLNFREVADNGDKFGLARDVKPQYGVTVFGVVERFADGPCRVSMSPIITQFLPAGLCDMLPQVKCEYRRRR
jgi:hypothetical protein